LAGMVATAVSPTIGVLTLATAGSVAWNSFGPVWVTWWLGDASGVLVVAPFLILWTMRPKVACRAPRVVSAMAPVFFVVLIGAIVFGGPAPAGRGSLPIEFLAVPVLVWAAFRFSQREASTAAVLLSGIAILGTLQGAGPFARGETNESLLLLQAYMA